MWRRSENFTVSPSLSVLITARNEEWLSHTVADVLAHSGDDTEVIVILDGYEASRLPTLDKHPRLSVLRHDAGLGQRGAINEAARMSTAKYIMKLDAHCAMEQGFDVKIMAALDGHRDWTLVPAQRNLHVFSWKCKTCGNRTYMGPTPDYCIPEDEKGHKLPNHNCTGKTFEKVLVWQPRSGSTTDFWRFDHELHFQYRGEYRGKWEKNAPAGDVADTMTCIGACWALDRGRYWEMGGLDEAHGSWGQMGTELACKTWLSGGRMVVLKSTWYAHMFRTRKDFSFPYSMPHSAQEAARSYSKSMWLNDAWPGQVYPLAWLINKFKPLPGWSDPEGAGRLAHIRASERNFYRTHPHRDRELRQDHPIVAEQVAVADEPAVP